MMTMSVATVSWVWCCLRTLLQEDMRIPVLVFDPVLDIPSDGPFWRLIDLLFFVVILPYQVTSPGVTPNPQAGSTAGCPCPCFLWPSSTLPILFPAPPHSCTFCLPGPGDCELLGTGTAQRPCSFPGSPCGIEGTCRTAGLLAQPGV